MTAASNFLPGNSGQDSRRDCSQNNFSPEDFIEDFVKSIPEPVALLFDDKIITCNKRFLNLVAKNEQDDLSGVNLRAIGGAEEPDEGGEIRKINGRLLQKSISGCKIADKSYVLLLLTDVTDIYRRFSGKLDSCQRQICHLVCEQIGSSGATRAAVIKVLQLASLNVNIVIEGEEGTGKSLICRQLFANAKNASPDSYDREIFDCKNADENFFQKIENIFAANFPAGSEFRNLPVNICLTNIDLLSLDAQSRFLKIFARFSARPGNFRFICTSTRSLFKMAVDGDLRQDLFALFNVGVVNLPPLRDRPDDILPLTDYYLNLLANGERSLPEKMKKEFLAYSWPGNVMELKNRIRLWLTEPPETEQICQGGSENAGENICFDSFSIEEYLNAREKDCIIQALKFSKGRKEEAARLLKMNLRTLHRRCSMLGI